MKKNKEVGKYQVFTRRWWKENAEWPNGLEPDGNARKTIISKGIETEQEAINIAKEWNATHKPGRYSVEAEFTKY